MNLPLTCTSCNSYTEMCNVSSVYACQLLYIPSFNESNVQDCSLALLWASNLRPTEKSKHYNKHEKAALIVILTLTMSEVPGLGIYAPVSSTSATLHCSRKYSFLLSIKAQSVFYGKLLLHPFSFPLKCTITTKELDNSNCTVATYRCRLDRTGPQMSACRTVQKRIAHSILQCFQPLNYHQSSTP